MLCWTYKKSDQTIEYFLKISYQVFLLLTFIQILLLASLFKTTKYMKQASSFFRFRFLHLELRPLALSFAIFIFYKSPKSLWLSVRLKHDFIEEFISLKSPHALYLIFLDLEIIKDWKYPRTTVDGAKLFNGIRFTV